MKLKMKDHLKMFFAVYEKDIISVITVIAVAAICIYIRLRGPDWLKGFIVAMGAIALPFAIMLSRVGKNK